MLARSTAILLALPLPVTAQIRASEVGTMSQMIDGTKITMEYSRPRARGREKLFGTKAVRWNETWTPGANWATTFETNKDLTLNGKPVAKGKYSVWLVVREKGDWTLVLDSAAHRYHMDPPDSTGAQSRIAVHPEAIPFTEVLTWSMPGLRATGGTLTMDWERVRIPVQVDVQPSLVPTFPAGEAAQYVGDYTFTEKDSAGKTKVSRFTVTHEDGTLKARFTPEDPYMKKFALIRIAPDWFAPGLYDETGQIYEVLKPDLIVEFARVRGRPQTFVIRDMEDEVWGTGERKN